MKQHGLYLILLAVLFSGAFLRVYRLGDPSMSADNLAFIGYCQKTEHAREVFSEWPRLQAYGHLPFAPACARFTLDLFGLEVTHFSVRLSSALWGVLGILGVFVLGLVLRQPALGLLLSALL
ncbi:MAG: hypothetical protein AAF492_28385, partial [Verrucomicrobiota bacterium]